MDACGGAFPGGALAARGQGAERPQISGGAALFLGPQHHLASRTQGVRELEQHLETVLAAEPTRRLRGVLPIACGAQRQRASGPDVRQHSGASACLGRRRQRGQDCQALGRSRGGFSTKIHLKTDFQGKPLDFHLTGGEASDSRQFETLLDIGPDIRPRAAITDKGYDAEVNREAARKRAICPVIPYRSNTKNKPAFFPKILYKTRARIEQTMGKLKRFKRIALRCEKTAQNYAALIAFVCGIILIKSVHRT
jgi:transposase